MNIRLISICTASSLVFASLSVAIQVQNRANQQSHTLQPASDDELQGEIKTIEFESKHLDEPREVKVYLPPGHDPKKRYPVIYTPDGFIAVKCENLEPLITSGKTPPFIIVGTASGPGGMRQLEYCPGWDPDQPEHFEKHEKFFIEEVIPWAEKEFGASRKRKDRVIYGSSNGAPFALTMANRHPKLFGQVFAFMVYGLKFDIFESELKEQLKKPTRYILVSGADDAHGVKSNRKVERLLKEKKFPVSSAIVEGFGHSSDLEYQELTPCVEAAFGKGKKYRPIGKAVDLATDKSPSAADPTTAPDWLPHLKPNRSLIQRIPPIQTP